MDPLLVMLMLQILFLKMYLDFKDKEKRGREADENIVDLI